MKLKNNFIKIIMGLSLAALASVHASANVCNDVASWVSNQTPTPVGMATQNNYVFADNNVTFQVKGVDVNAPFYKSVDVSTIQVLVNGTYVGAVNGGGGNFSLQPFMRQLLPGQTFSVQYKYVYKVKAGFFTVCNTETGTKVVNCQYAPSITNADFTIVANTGYKCLGSIDISVTSSKVAIDRTTVSWNVPSFLTYKQISAGLIRVEPGPGYDLSNTIASISASVSIPNYGIYLAAATVNAQINTLPKGTLSVASAYRGCTFTTGPQAPMNGNVSITIGKVNLTTPIVYTITAPHCPTGNCPGVSSSLNATTNVLTISEAASAVGSLPTTRNYTVKLSSSNAGCELASAQTTVTFSAESYFGAGRLFSGLQAASVASNISVITKDASNTADDELYFINMATNKLSRYIYSLTANDWILQALPTPVLPKITTATPTSNTVAALVSNVDGNTYVYYVDVNNKMQWLSLKPDGSLIQNGNVCPTCNFDNIAAGEYLKGGILTKTIFGHQPNNTNFIFWSNTSNPAYNSSTNAAYYENEPNSTIYSSVAFLPNGNLVDLKERDYLVIRNSAGPWGDVLATSPKIGIKLNTNIQYTNLGGGSYNIYFINSSGSIQYISYNSTTKQFGTPQNVITGVVVRDFAVNPATGTVYYGDATSNTVTSRKLNLIWDGNLVSPTYPAANIKNIPSTGQSSDATGVGHYTFAFPHLYYVANADYGVANPLFNTWFYEGCTPVNFRTENAEGIATSASTNNYTENMANTVALFCMPNPATDKVSVGFHLETSSDVLITLHDATGRELFTVANGVYHGQNTLAVNEKLQAGIYFVKMNANNKTITSRLVVR